MSYTPVGNSAVTGAGNQSGLNITGFAINGLPLEGNTYEAISVSLTGDNTGNVYLNFTPVPESALLLPVLSIALPRWQLPLFELRASSSDTPIARRTWLVRPDPLAQALPRLKATSRTSESKRVVFTPSRRTLKLPR